jgi:hypothetical protein
MLAELAPLIFDFIRFLVPPPEELIAFPETPNCCEAD